jgi:cation:H+ antiporter
MLLNSFFLLIGLCFITWGGDRFVTGASAIARHLGISPLLVGLTIVAFGTSAPEIFVSAIASVKGNTGVALGNVFGSNIANIGLVIGFTALVCPLEVHSSTLRREYPLLFLVMLLVALLFTNGFLGRIDGIILLLVMVAVILWFVSIGKKQSADEPLAVEYSQEIPKHMTPKKAYFWFAVGTVSLLGGSELLVQCAVNIARQLGVSDMVIGLTIVAVGTSLPELMASLISALKGEPDIAIGNVLGSNIFNFLAVLAMPALISPSHYSAITIFREFSAVLILTLLMYIMSYGHQAPQRISRVSGAILLMFYVMYLVSLGLDVPC